MAQLNLFKTAQMLDCISENLEAKGYLKEAEEIDIIANTLEACGIEMTNFMDEMANKDISIEDSLKVLHAFNDLGADSEHSCAKITGVDAYTCKIILDTAHQFNLLK